MKNLQKKRNRTENDALIQCDINLIYSYKLKENEFHSIDIDTTEDDNVIYSHNENDSSIEINLTVIIDKLSKLVELDNMGISFLDTEINHFVFYGVYKKDFNYHKLFFIPRKFTLSQKGKKRKIFLTLKLRQSVYDENETMLQGRYIEEHNEIIADKRMLNYANQNIKSKRGKERKISEIIFHVYAWRRLYYGIKKENGEIIKMSLDDAAKIIGISKKSLDDYLIQLRIGKTFGFDFNEHKDDKVGVLRNFVKANKANYDANFSEKDGYVSYDSNEEKNKESNRSSPL